MAGFDQPGSVCGPQTMMRTPAAQTALSETRFAGGHRGDLAPQLHERHAVSDFEMKTPAMYTKDAVFLPPGAHPVNGREAIGKFLEEALRLGDRKNHTFAIVSVEEDGRYAIRSPAGRSTSSTRPANRRNGQAIPSALRAPNRRHMADQGAHLQHASIAIGHHRRRSFKVTRKAPARPRHLLSSAASKSRAVRPHVPNL